MDTTQVYGITVDAEVQKKIKFYVEAEGFSTQDKVSLLYACICDHVLAALSTEQAAAVKQDNRIKEGVYEKLYNDILGRCLDRAFKNSY